MVVVIYKTSEYDSMDRKKGDTAPVVLFFDYHIIIYLYINHLFGRYGKKNRSAYFERSLTKDDRKRNTMTGLLRPTYDLQRHIPKRRCQM